MKNKSARSNLAFGVCVLSAILFSGCAGTRQPMYSVDLNHYQIDCNNRAAQIRFLESQKTSRDDRAANNLWQALTPWTWVTDPNTAGERAAIGSGKTDWLLNQKLLRLAYDCGPNSPY